MPLTDEDVKRIARAVADELDERKETRRVEAAKCDACNEGWTEVGNFHRVPNTPGLVSCTRRNEVACISCESPMTGSVCWRCGTVQK